MSSLAAEEEAITASEVLMQLEKAWTNEMLAPELLEAKPELVECMMEQLSEMEENIRRVKKGDFVASLHQLEIERIRFVVASYLRTRLKKIETHYVILLEKSQKLLSVDELAYAKEYARNIEKLFDGLALRRMPSNLRNLDGDKLAVMPNDDAYVFFRVLRRCNEVAAEEDEVPVDLERGSQHIMRYRPVASLLADNSILLL
ncbi:DNA replication complex GINS protein SLD5-like [Oscarella lobularis]|uniref:DNA replication complex GINS protein SLD5-like n=1 Tax=Oscarella lobularis TaxID=121494 RepID=UPI00331431E1